MAQNNGIVDAHQNAHEVDKIAFNIVSHKALNREDAWKIKNNETYFRNAVFFMASSHNPATTYQRYLYFLTVHKYK